MAQRRRRYAPRAAISAATAAGVRIARRISRVVSISSLLHAFEGDDDLDLIGDAAGHAFDLEVGHLDDEGGLDAGPLRAGRELALAGELDGDGDGLGDAVQSEVAGDLEDVGRVAFLHRGAL